MFTSLLIMAAASVAPITAYVHRTNVEHQGKTLEVSYRADTKVSVRQIGMSAGTRPSTERCLWTARLAVVRNVSNASGASLSQRLDEDNVLRGSHFGKCSENKSQVATSVVRRGGDIEAHLADVARRDAARLAADLSAVQHLAAN